MDKNNEHIKCDVENCKYQNNDDNYCTLDEIKVTCSTNDEDCSKDNTMCDSYESIDEKEE